MNTPGDCCSPCPTTPPVNIPGTPGLQGPPGIDGFNAFSLVANNFNVPAVNNNVSVTFDECAWMVIGQNVFIAGPANFQVVSVTGTTGAVLKFLGYPNDVMPGTVIAAGAKCSPAGLQGVLPAGLGLIAVTMKFPAGAATFGPDPSATALYVECIGAGGSGGGGGSTASDASIGSGGGGGAYSAVWITTNVQQTFNIVAGNGGAAPAAGANPGNVGDDTTFSDAGFVVICRAKGGGAGGAGAAPGTTPVFVAGGAGGAGPTPGNGVGDMKHDGDCGGASQRVSGTVGISGRGAAGPLGAGALAVIAQGNGVAGGSSGAGGSGGNTLNGGAATSGGAGGPGVIRIWQFG